MIQQLVKHGDDQVIVLNKKILEAAGISPESCVEILPYLDGGLIVKPVDVFGKKFQELKAQYKDVMHRLADL
jgi:hypothetical protein